LCYKRKVPKVVNIEARREELAEALWRVIRRDGLERASVRNVAREAGISMGALRHYFGSQNELLAFAMRLVIERARGRVGALDFSSRGPRQAVEMVLREVLPLNAERRAEVEVWLALTGRALVDPTLRGLRDEGYDLLQGLCRLLVGVLVESGEAGPGLDVDLEAELLYAVVDGLAVHAVVRPEQATPEGVAALLAHHLDGLCRRARSAPQKERPERVCTTGKPGASSR
jgi:AcrR family transcriptional regulator